MHIPVLLKETIDLLNPQSNENFVDCTIGEGGHSLAILQKTSPLGKILGIDLDVETLERVGKKLESYKERTILVQDNFKNLENILEKSNFKNISGILFDLGMSSISLEESERGFSFQKEEPLLMNYGSDYIFTASEIVNDWSREDIEKILKDFGEERFAKNISQEIVKRRVDYPIKTTTDLVEIIRSAIPKKFQRGKIHPATKTFQAIRIAVNNELENIQLGLEGAVNSLEKGGKIAVISFHSLEDRIVKWFFKQKKEEGILEILTKKPITPSDKEMENNPRARSAKLRVVVVI